MPAKARKVGQMDFELWRNIPGYEGIYMASTLGRIKSVKSYKRSKRENWIIKQCPVSNGYCHTSLSKDNIRISRETHRWILLTFIGPPPTGMEASHLNGNRHDNRLQNLAWMTKSENAQIRELHKSRRTE